MGKKIDKSLPNNGQAVIAEYVEQAIPDYQGNPLIEALPPILSEEAAVEVLMVYPQINPGERQLEPHYRYHCVSRLLRYFQPLGQHLNLEKRFSSIIRQGYIGRNPRKRDYSMLLQQGYQRIIESQSFSEWNDIRTTASSFSFIGVSGVGKTTAIERILALYPQVIVHETPLNLYQLVWLKLDCPFDGSLKGLCINFFTEIDRLLGTNYYQKFASNRLSIDAMLARMAQIANLHCVGVLIIDEIQHLNLAKSGGADKMLNFFVTLVNTIGIPVVMVGTPKALSVLNHDFRQARRSTGQGNMVWERLEQGDNWDLLTEGMWVYQWTRNETSLTQKLKDALYEESQGIIDIAVKIFMMCQWRAIATEEETISSSLIHQVAKDSLQLVRPMLLALKSGNLLEISKYDDIRPVDVDEYYLRFQPGINLKEQIRLQRMKEAERRQQKSESLLEQVVLALLQLRIEPNAAQVAAERVLADSNESGDAGEIIQRAARLALGSGTPNSTILTKETKKVKGSKTKKREPLVLIEIVNRGKEKQWSAYDSLKESGWIKSPTQDLTF